MAIKKPGQISPDNREPMATTPRIELVSLDKLRPYENNARTHSPEQIDKLRASLREFGFVNPILVDRDYGIIAGHGRLMAAQAEGMETVPCVFVEHLTETQKRAYILADNRLAELAGWDDKLLQAELDSLKDFDFDVGTIGFEIGAIDFDDWIRAEDDGFELGDEPTEEPVSQRGHIYQLGRHRLMCGDSTSGDDVGALLDNATIDLMVTDPPYNVDYASADGKTIQNDSMGKQQFVDFLTAAFRNANEVMRPGAAFYIWHASSSQMQFEQAINEAGMDVRQQLIWVKNSLVLGRQDYQWMHEPCFYGWKDGAAHYFVDDRKQTTVIHEDKPTRSELHPTMKPIKLIERLVKNSSRQGENVLDLFGGSGTTLVTCEQINRKCYMMELDEKYCDVIINRWESLTGERAQLV